MGWPCRHSQNFLTLARVISSSCEREPPPRGGNGGGSCTWGGLLLRREEPFELVDIAVLDLQEASLALDLLVGLVELTLSLVTASTSLAQATGEASGEDVLTLLLDFMPLTLGDVVFR